MVCLWCEKHESKKKSDAPQKAEKKAFLLVDLNQWFSTDKQL
jgi:hypothetical protein